MSINQQQQPVYGIPQDGSVPQQSVPQQNPVPAPIQQPVNDVTTIANVQPQVQQVPQVQQNETVAPIQSSDQMQPGQVEIATQQQTVAPQMTMQQSVPQMQEQQAPQMQQGYAPNMQQVNQVNQTPQMQPVQQQTYNPQMNQSQPQVQQGYNPQMQQPVPQQGYGMPQQQGYANQGYNPQMNQSQPQVQQGYMQQNMPGSTAPGYSNTPYVDTTNIGTQTPTGHPLKQVFDGQAVIVSVKTQINSKGNLMARGLINPTPNVPNSPTYNFICFSASASKQVQMLEDPNYAQRVPFQKIPGQTINFNGHWGENVYNGNTTLQLLVNDFMFVNAPFLRQESENYVAPQPASPADMISGLNGQQNMNQGYGMPQPQMNQGYGMPPQQGYNPQMQQQAPQMQPMNQGYPQMQQGYNPQMQQPQMQQGYNPQNQGFPQQTGMPPIPGQ